MLGRAETLRLRRGDLLWRQGDPARHFCWIESGLVKIVRASPEGVETILGVFGPGESIGDSAVLEGARYPADAVAASRGAVVTRSPAAGVLTAAGSDPTLAAALRLPLLRHTRALRQKIEVVSAGSVPQRLATLLLDFCERFGVASPRPGSRSAATPPEQDWRRLAIALSRIELAALIGARVETTIRILSRWKKSGLARAEPGGLAFHLAALRGVAVGRGNGEDESD